MRVLVCGGRDYADKGYVYQALDRVWREAPMDTMIVIQGGAKGADALAREWCMERSVEYINVPANWDAHGRAAGPLRNEKMLRKYVPELVLAFPGGRGTEDMIKRAEKAGVPLQRL